MKEEKSQFLSIRDYAGRCGVSPQQTANRIKKGMIEVDKIESERCKGFVINITIFPPVKKQKAGRPRISEKI